MSVKVYTKGTTFQRRLRLAGKTSIQPNRTGVVREASSRTLPDVLMLDNPDVQQIAAAGALAPLDDFGLSADGYAKGVVAASTYQGKLYGLQPVTNTIGLFYDKDMLDKAGIKPPTTWDELKSAAMKLTSGKRYGIAFSAPAAHEAAWQFLPFMWSNGGEEENIATPEVAQALRLSVDLVKNGSASKSVVNWARPTSTTSSKRATRP
jgi:multiple sugar transport system substrate-binding protein